MKIVRVQYTTTAAFAPTNQANIQQIVEELNKLNHPGISYSTYTLPDGKTFMHLDHFEDEAAHEVLVNLDSFKKFDEALWASGLEAAPELDLLTLVAGTSRGF